MGFQCHHCGECCRNVSAQINLSLADIDRICKFLNCDVTEIKDKMGIFPFLNENNTFDYELGLHLPCKFRKDSRCTIYPARPLNCRLFPYFLLNTDVINPDFFCLKTERNYTEEENNKYKEYTKFIGKQVIEEGKITDQFYEENNFKFTSDIKLSLPLIYTEKKIIELRIKEALKIKKEFPKLFEKLAEELAKEKFTEFNEINQKESKIL